MSAEFLKKDFQTLVASMLKDLSQPGLGRTPLTDTNEGSVVRTLVEAYARELALCYEQLERVYRMGYLDTANGQALDQVVALVGVRRRPAGWLEGMVTFRRATPAPAEIPIPAGTLISGKDAPLCETAERAALPMGATQVTVKMRSVEEYKPKADRPGQGALPAGRLTFMPRTINGIDTVSNESDLVLAKKPESDEELRERTRHEADGSNLGTLAALKIAAARLGYSEVKLEEPPDLPGVVRMRVEGLTPERQGELQAALDAARPAGVKVILENTAPLYVGVRATLLLDRERSEHEKETIRASIKSALAAYFDKLAIGETVRWSKVSNILGMNPAVIKVEPATPGQGLIPALWSEGGRQEQGSLVVEGDVLPRPDQRPLLDLDKQPLELKLVPAALAVQVDALVTLSAGRAQGATRQAAQDLKIREALGEALQKIKPGEGFTLQSICKAVKDAGPSIELGPVQLTLLHRANGRVVELRAEKDGDVLAEREQLKLGKLEVKS